MLFPSFPRPLYENFVSHANRTHFEERLCTWPHLEIKVRVLELGNDLLNSTKDMKVYSTTEESAEEFHLNDHIRGFGSLTQMIEPYQFIQNNKWYVKVHRNC